MYEIVESASQPIMQPEHWNIGFKLMVLIHMEKNHTRNLKKNL